MTTFELTELTAIICSKCAKFPTKLECTASTLTAGYCLLFLSVFVIAGLWMVWRGWKGFRADFKFYKSRGWRFDKDSGLLFGKPNKNHTDAMPPFLRFAVGYPGLMAGGIMLIFGALQ